jgi:6,7-dimethyl-8-ribityllumazine synthase
MLIAHKMKFEVFDASSWRLGFVVAHFNRQITEQLEQSARLRAREYGLGDDNIEVVSVAGAIEIPLVLKAMSKTKRYQALLAIGCVIEGDTPHFDYVCKFVTEGILKVQMDYDTPIGFGVLTCHDEAQAEARSKLGGEHLDAVLNQAIAIQSVTA